MLPEPYQFFGNEPVVPVIVIHQLDQAVPLARALVAGGVTSLEVTLRTAFGLDAIRLIAKEVPEATVGAGTVCNADQFSAVVDAGAQFVVTPGSTDALLKIAADSGIPTLPGAVTASEIMRVLDVGFPIIKFFPAATSGGVAAIKAFSGPFGHARFLPTGGIDPANAEDYLALPNVVAVGGSWLTPSDAVASNDWSRITDLAKASAKLGPENSAQPRSASA